MKVLLVENDRYYVDRIQSQLVMRFRGVMVDQISTELEFRRRLPQLIETDYTFAIFDVMVPWCLMEDLGKSDAEKPPEVQAEHDGRAKKRGGLRCLRRFTAALQDGGKHRVPSVLYTILEEFDLKEELMDNEVLLAKIGEGPELLRQMDLLLNPPEPARVLG